MAQTSERMVNGIKTRVLHNKDYVEVNTRVQILHELRRKGEIKEFEMVDSHPSEIAGQVFWRVSARIDGKLYIGNAEVKLDAPKNTPDGTNPFSCAETSAFGRMLAFAGLGTVESIASYEEVMRGQPFTAVIEEPKNGNKVVESRQIAALQPKNPVDELKRRALEAQFITGGNKDELAAMWKNRLRAVFQREVTDQDLYESEALQSTLRDAIERYTARQAAATSGK